MKQTVYGTKLEAMAAVANKKGDLGQYFVDRIDNGWFIVGERCRFCGAIYVNGRCPVAKKDCGR